jgi:hypothetical protein
MVAIDSLDTFPPRLGNTNTEKLCLSVNMTCSDEQLIDEFKKVLRDSRSSHNFNSRNSPFNESSFKKWHKLAILPYLDLNLWAKASGVLIEHKVFSKAIYPEFDEEYSETRTIKEKVAPLALKLLRRETLKTICAQG